MVKCGSESFTRRVHKGGFPALAGSSTSQISGMLQPGLEGARTGSQRGQKAQGKQSTRCIPALPPFTRSTSTNWVQKIPQSNLQCVSRPKPSLEQGEHSKAGAKEADLPSTWMRWWGKSWLPSASATYHNVRLDGSLSLTPTLVKWEIPLAWLCIRINRDTVSSIVLSM